jgi:hypothetical protein
VSFVHDVAPRITPAALSAAAREFSWENEEGVLLRMTDLVTANPVSAENPQQMTDARSY